MHYYLAIFSLGFAAALSLSGAPALPQTSGSWGSSSEYGLLLKKGKRETMRGNVISFSEVTPLAGMEPGVQMKVNVSGREVDVHLGPRWFVLEKDINLTRGEPVSIVGLSVRIGEKPVFVAEQVKRKDQSTVVRESAGELKRDSAAPPQVDHQMQALTVLSKRCASCHQSTGHAGAAFLKEKAMDDKETVATVLRVLKSGKMPPAHQDFAKTVEGKLVIDWLDSQSRN